MIKAVLFDLDGVLMDSEVYDQSINVDFINEYHYKTDPEIFRIWIGGNPKIDYWSMLKDQIDPEDDFETFRTQFNAYHWVRRVNMPFRDYMFPDTQETVKGLFEKGYKLACCSSSSPEYIDQALTDMEIKEYFEVIVSGHDFTESKPNPEIYLYAMERFALNNEECLVVEDSPYGIEAGKRANMTVVAKRDHHFSMDQSGSDLFIDDLKELFGVLEELNK